MSVVLTPVEIVKYPIPRRQSFSNVAENKIKEAFGKKSVGLVLEATINETHNIDIEYTEFPVEAGRSLSDHAIISPDILDITCLISDDPGTVFSGGRLENLIVNQKFSSEVFEYLKTLAKDFAQVDLETGHGIYTNMVITHIGSPKTSETANSARLDITFEHKETAFSKKVDAVKAKTEQDQKKMKSKTNKGKTPKQDPTTKQEDAAYETVLWKLSN